MNLLKCPEIESFFHGILCLHEVEDGLFVQRITTEQQNVLNREREMLGIRGRCAAGVSIQLRTDSPWMDLEVEVAERARNFFGVDVEVDGEIVASVHAKHVDGVFKQRLFDLQNEPRFERDIRVYLPHCCAMKFNSVGICDDADVEAVEPAAFKLLCFGDSITQGMDAISPLATYTHQLGRLLNAELFNVGIGGHVFDAEFIDPAFPVKPNFITVAYGTNDWNHLKTADEIEENVTAFLQKLTNLYPDVHVALITPLWRKNWNEEKVIGNLRDFSKHIDNAAADYENVYLINGFELVPHDERFYADGLHPNELGFMHFAANLYRQLHSFVPTVK